MKHDTWLVFGRQGLSHDSSRCTELLLKQSKRFYLMPICPSRQEIDESKREVFCCTSFSGSSFEIVSLNTRRLQRSSIIYTYIFTIAHNIPQYFYLETEREGKQQTKMYITVPPSQRFAFGFSNALTGLTHQPHWPHWCSTGCGSQGSELIFRFGMFISSSLFRVDDYRDI